VIMCRPLHRGYAGATGGMHVICIWGFTLRELLIKNIRKIFLQFTRCRKAVFIKRLLYF
jgi:hypothetical protein